MITFNIKFLNQVGRANITPAASHVDIPLNMWRIWLECSDRLTCILNQTRRVLRRRPDDGASGLNMALCPPLNAPITSQGCMNRFGRVGGQFGWYAKYFCITLTYKKNRAYSFEHHYICDIQNPLCYESILAILLSTDSYVVYILKLKFWGVDKICPLLPLPTAMHRARFFVLTNE